MSDSRQVDMERKRGGADRLAVSSPADDVETWARLMKKLLHEACHRVNKSTTKTLSEAERLAVRKRYRTILTQGDKELPENPPRPKGKRGRIAKSDAHNLHERLMKHEESVLRFMGDPDVSFTNNSDEQKIRMARVKMKVSGCFRTRFYAEAWCRISSYLSSMAVLGYKPLVAIQIALAGKAADKIKMHHPHTTQQRGEQLRKFMHGHHKLPATSHESTHEPLCARRRRFSRRPRRTGGRSRIPAGRRRTRRPLPNGGRLWKHLCFASTPI